MASPRDWADAFLAQAKEDLVAAEGAFGSQAHSTYCMLIQMVFEKLAKAAFARQGAVPPRSHQVATRLIGVLRRAPHGARLMGGGARAFAAVVELEMAHPAVVAQAVRSGGVTAAYPQLEYPWENPVTAAAEWPAAHLPMAKRVADPSDRIGADLLRTARAFVHDFDAMFP